jgi:predicted nucleic acid-binding protein
MTTYIDASVLLRVAFRQPGALKTWSEVEEPVSSELIRLECLRTIDRARLAQGLSELEVAERREIVLEALGGFHLIPVDSEVLARASDPFPTLINSLDAIHLATAILSRSEVGSLEIATHDVELGLAARAMGFEVLGLAN